MRQQSFLYQQKGCWPLSETPYWRMLDMGHTGVYSGSRTQILRARHVCAIVIANSVSIPTAAAFAPKGMSSTSLPWCWIPTIRRQTTSLNCT